jgi:maleylpyruvate isomerase
VSQSATDLDARAALRLRQGVGARYDAASAPAEDLLLARRGTAYFARRLAALDDGALDGSAARGGVSRRWVIAQLGYHARDMAQRVASGRGAMIRPLNARGRPRSRGAQPCLRVPCAV